MKVQKKTLTKICIHCSIAFTVAVSLLLFSHSKTYQALELKAFDLRFALRGPRPAQAPVIHIDIDDASIAKLGRWPWPRSVHARLVDILRECGARYVLFDVLFTERMQDRPEEDLLFAGAIQRAGNVYLPFYFPEDRPAPDPALKELLTKDVTISPADLAAALGVDVDALKEKITPAKKYVMDEIVTDLVRQSPDTSFEKLLEQLESTRGWYLFPAEENYIRENFDHYLQARAFINRFARKYSAAQADAVRLQEYRGLNVPIRQFIDVIRGSGYINADTDDDGVMRRIPLLMRYEDRVFAQMAVGCLADYLQVADIAAGEGRIVLRNAHTQTGIRDIVIPVDREGRMLINWIGKWAKTFPHVSYSSFLRLQETRERLRAQRQADLQARDAEKAAEVAAYLAAAEEQIKKTLTETVQGKICFVGLSATGTQDLGPVPLEAKYPYVGASSNLIDTILSEKFLRKEEGALKVLVFLFAALVIGLGSLLKLWKSLLVAAGYTAGYFLAALWAFDKLGIWIDLVGPSAAVVFGFSAITSFRYFTEEKEKRWIKHAFSHYLSAEVINELMSDPSKLKLGGERKNLTVLFSDVRGFTVFSESHQPEEVVALLNQLLTEQVEVIFKNRGTLDKFVGDEIMAVFGAPGEVHRLDHAIAAVRTAFQIQEKLKALKEKWTAERTTVLHIGIGINSGDMVVGNMGSAERMDYTVIGDNVNLAARLCSAAGPGEIIVSEATYEQAKEQIIAERLEPISVKGKSKPISIYRVTGLK